MPEILEGFELLHAAASRPQHIVPGHDPKRYSAMSRELEGVAVRLDVVPTQ